MHCVMPGGLCNVVFASCKPPLVIWHRKVLYGAIEVFMVTQF